LSSTASAGLADIYSGFGIYTKSAKPLPAGSSLIGVNYEVIDDRYAIASMQNREFSSLILCITCCYI